MRKSLALVVLLAMASTFTFAAAKDEKEEDLLMEETVQRLGKLGLRF